MIPNPFRRESQNYILWNALHYGVVNTEWLANRNWTTPSRRMSDVRKKLEKYGYTIKAERKANNNFQYYIAPLPVRQTPWAQLVSFIKSLFQRRQAQEG